ncbi:hypothetical protein QNI19_29995 [Cytophagaceae bacterium DM2B3-1]|uniref:YcxB-like protein domain-containing protein n=1 Tax=Xanthocytophaga flava TaxID=3048013 RepID=A0ABT7CTW2_9BACT|nr:hypothetical protein [Xanthocytophaga flavus]MDJ1497208.1 hypothetical protein [Xanthocytophaga flavus]
MKKDQIDRDIQAGKLSSKEFQLDTFRAVIVLSWLFVFTAAAVVIVIWDWIHTKQHVTGIIIVAILAGLFFMAQLLSFFREDRLMSIETGLDSEQNRQLIRQCIHKLGWKLTHENTYVLVACTSVWSRLLEQQIVVLLEDQYIHVNVKHIGTSRGRFPYLFGLNQRRINQLMKNIGQKYT